MRTVGFQGHSDDLFCMDGERRGEPDEMGCFSGHASVKIVDAEGRGLIVSGGYAPNYTPGASWVIGVALLDEDIPLPDWPMRWKTGDNGYSPRLEIDLPDSATVARLDSE
jgi:hypothetical protein